MKSKEMYQVQVGTELTHKRYGHVVVKEIVKGFGVIIEPTTEEGKLLLSCDSGAEIGTPLLEDSARQLEPLT